MGSDISRRTFLAALTAAGVSVGVGSAAVRRSATAATPAGTTLVAGSVPVAEPVLDDLVRLGASISGFVPPMPGLITLPRPSLADVTKSLSALPPSRAAQVVASAQRLTVGGETPFSDLPDRDSWARISQRGSVVRGPQGPSVAPGGVGQAVSFLIALQAPSVSVISEPLAAIYVGAAGAYEANAARLS